MSGRKTKQSSSLPNIMDIFLREGPEVLQRRLNSLALEDLKSLVKDYNLDPTKTLKGKREKEQIIALIINRLNTRNNKGMIFLNY